MTMQDQKNPIKLGGNYQSYEKRMSSPEFKQPPMHPPMHIEEFMSKSDVSGIPLVSAVSATDRAL